MKIIAIHNHNDETVSDHLTAEGVDEPNGTKLVEELNRYVHDHSYWFYRLVADNHRLRHWEP